MSRSRLDKLRLRAAEILTEYNSEEDLSTDSLKESVGNAVGMASSSSVGLATAWNCSMVALGVFVAVSTTGYARMAGVAWAIFNAYPIVRYVWRWLNGR